MEPAAKRLEPVLAALRFAQPDPPVVTNVEAAPNGDASRIPELLTQQVTAPVRFTEMVLKLRELGVTRFLEVGPGRVLSGLLARIERRSKRANFGAETDFEPVREFIAGG